jgi:hypothetical protein
MAKGYVLAAAAAAVLAAVTACRTPMFTIPDSGSVMDRGEFEISPGFTSVNYSGGGVSGQESRNFGGQISMGMGRLPLIGIRTEGAMRLEYADHVSSEVEDWFYLRMQYKFRIAETVCFMLASTMNWRDDSFDWSPFDFGLIGSFPLASGFDVNTYVTANFIDREEEEDNSVTVLPGIGASMGYSPGMGAVTVLPGVSYIWDQEDTHSRWAWSLFLSFLVGAPTDW